MLYNRLKNLSLLSVEQELEKNVILQILFTHFYIEMPESANYTLFAYWCAISLFHNNLYVDIFIFAYLFLFDLFVK